MKARLMGGVVSVYSVMLYGNQSKLNRSRSIFHLVGCPVNGMVLLKRDREADRGHEQLLTYTNQIIRHHLFLGPVIPWSWRASPDVDDVYWRNNLNPRH